MLDWPPGSTTKSFIVWPKKCFFEQLLFCGWTNEQVYIRYFWWLKNIKSLFYSCFCGKIKHCHSTSEYMNHKIWHKKWNSSLMLWNKIILYHTSSNSMIKKYFEIYIDRKLFLFSELYTTVNEFSPANNVEKHLKEVQPCQLISWYILTPDIIRVNIVERGFIKNQTWRNIHTFIRVSDFRIDFSPTSKCHAVIRKVS